MPDENLIDAYMWHRQNAPLFYRNGEKVNAWAALIKARRDVAENKKRYPSMLPDFNRGDADRPQYGFCEHPEQNGLRLVGKVEAETRRGDVWANRATCGWYTDPEGAACEDGTGLCWGEVYQLPARRGVARFVAAYRFGEYDGGPAVDLSRVFESDSTSSCIDNYHATALDAARDCARYADELARIAAEKERDYQSAWQAGRRFADECEARDTAKADLRELLAERRQAKREAIAKPALCKAVDSQARELIRDMQKSIKTLRKLASGEGIGHDCYASFYSGDADLRAAFCDGASLSSFPEL